ncbi:hypothetical protein ETB97_003351 [Aspergillus alliaceus]|uniref:Uncharacterized protein n=1 Tax=Petromyces alliaceus TaxID=209559 RepID=A0A8H6A9X0_PETAA|nr:hypothetical protein ETB97_003351 [Aspergillus burnettii]
MHYLDDEFPLQFPFHETAHLGKREWLLTILSSTKAVYYATLSLSLLHKEACSDTSERERGLIWRDEKTRYFIRALQESQQLQQQLQSGRSKDGLKALVKALANIVQLISFEVNETSILACKLPVSLNGMVVILSQQGRLAASSMCRNVLNTVLN